MRTLVVLLIALAADAAAGPDKLATSLDALANAAKCSDHASPWRLWCIAASGWATGKAGQLPNGKVLVGVTIELEDGKDTAQQLVNAVSLTAFAIGKDGKVKVTTVRPENDDERSAAAAAVAALSLQLKGKVAVAKLPKDLASYVSGLQGAYDAKQTANEWTWNGQSAGRARQVGSNWVIVETPAKQNGFFVTVLTSAWASE
jgi:hypothetical protein